MKTLLKLVASLFILIIAALIIIPVLFKDDIVQLVKQESNNAVNAKIDFGEFDLSLIKNFPNFHFAIEEVSVRGIQEFEGVELAGIKELDFVIDLMSVVKGESIEIKRIHIIEPSIHAKVLADGAANYLIAKEDGTTEETEETEAGESTAFRLALKELKIVGGKVVYDDATFPMHMAINGLDVELSGDFTENITSIATILKAATFDLQYDGIQYVNAAEVNLNAMMEMNLEEFKFTFKENELTVNKLPLAFEGWVAMPEEAIDMDLTYMTKETDFIELLSLIPAEFAKELEGVKTEGVLSVAGYVNGTYLDSLYPAFGVHLQVANAMFQYPDLPKAVKNIQINAKVDSEEGGLDNTIVNVERFHIEIAENPFDFNLYLSNPISDPYIRAGMKGRLMLDNIKDVIPMEENDELNGTFTSDIRLSGRLSTLENEEYEDFEATGSLLVEKFHYSTDSLDYPIDLSKASLEFSPKFVALNEMEMTLGKSDLSADGRLENFIAYALKDNQVLSGILNVNASLLDINELAGIDPEEEEEESTDSSAVEEPMEVLLIPKDIAFVTRAKIDRLVYDNILIENIQGGIDVKEQKVSLTETAMQLLGGTMTMNGFYETTDSVQPTYDFGMNIRGFSVEQTVATFNTVEIMAPLAKHAKGNYSTSLTIKGALDQQMEPIYESMNGKGKLNTQSISIEGYKPLQKIADMTKNKKLNPMSLNDAAISFTISNGKVFVDPFTNKIGNTKLTIAGSNSFDQTIDYVFSFEIPREEFGAAANQAVDGLLTQAANKGIDLDVAKTINLDIRLVGDATNPEIKTDLKKAKSDATQQLKDKAKEELEKKKKELEQKAKDELEKQKKELEQKAKDELDKKKKEAEEELKKKKKEAEEELKKKAKDKLKGLFGG